MRGDLTIKILETIGNLAITSIDIFETMLKAGYGASAGKIEYEFNKIQRARLAENFQKAEEAKIKQRFYSVMYKLKKEGLITEAESVNKRKKLFSITEKGKKKIIYLKKEREEILSVDYRKLESVGLTIIAFDIPEKERHKRDWLRAVLKSIGFNLLQKSIFIGRAKVPKELINDLSRLRILDFVEIFEITKTGSLRHIT